MLVSHIDFNPKLSRLVTTTTTIFKKFPHLLFYNILLIQKVCDKDLVYSWWVRPQPLLGSLFDNDCIVLSWRYNLGDINMFWRILFTHEPNIKNTFIGNYYPWKQFLGIKLYDFYHTRWISGISDLEPIWIAFHFWIWLVFIILALNQVLIS